MGAIGPISAALAANAYIGPFDPRIAAGAGNGGAANYGYANVFTVSKPVTVSKCRFKVVTQNGNIDVAICTIVELSANQGTATTLASLGATALAAPGAQEVNFLAPITLVPGIRYWMFCTFSGSGTILAYTGTTFDFTDLATHTNQCYSTNNNVCPFPGSFPVTYSASGRGHVVICA